LHPHLSAVSAAQSRDLCKTPEEIWATPWHNKDSITAAITAHTDTTQTQGKGLEKNHDFKK